MQGTVKWYSAEKGYGFIDGGEGADHFVHRSAVERAGLTTLREGMRLEYELLTNTRNGKMAAENLRVR